MEDALAALKTEFRNRGWNRRPVGPVVFELAVHVSLALFGMYLVELHGSSLDLEKLTQEIILEF